MNIQEILAFGALILAVLFLGNKFFFKTTKSKKACGKSDCGCH